MQPKCVNWLGVGATALVAFSTAAIAATAIGQTEGAAIQLALLNAVFQGVLAFAIELKTESRGFTAFPLMKVLPGVY
jgi:hypothetical protein